MFLVRDYGQHFVEIGRFELNMCFGPEIEAGRGFFMNLEVIG